MKREYQSMDNTKIVKERENSTRDPSLKSLPEDLCSGFLCPEKIHRPQPGLNPRTLDLEVSTLPRDHRGRLSFYINRLTT